MNTNGRAPVLPTGPGHSPSRANVLGDDRACTLLLLGIQRIWDRTIDPGKAFDLTLSLDRASDGYTATDDRRATKVLLTV